MISAMPCAIAASKHPGINATRAGMRGALGYVMVFGVLICASSRATQFCVASDLALNAAMAFAQNAGVNDEIDLPGCTIGFTQQLVYAPTNVASLRVVGGWNTYEQVRTFMDGIVLPP